MPTFLVPPTPVPSAARIRFARVRAWFARLRHRDRRDRDDVRDRAWSRDRNRPDRFLAERDDARDRDDRFLATRGDARDRDDDPANRLARASAWIGEAARRHRGAIVKAAFATGAGALLLVAMGGTWGIAPATAIAAGPSAAGPSAAGPSAAGPITSPTVAGDATPAPPPATSPDPAPSPPPPAPPATAKAGKAQQLAGKLNLNTATAEQLVLLPTVGPSKAERILAWRKRNGAFRRVADLRRVKGFGYKTFKKLEPFLAIDGDTTLARR